VVAGQLGRCSAVVRGRPPTPAATHRVGEASNEFLLHPLGRRAVMIGQPPCVPKIAHESFREVFGGATCPVFAEVLPWIVISGGFAIVRAMEGYAKLLAAGQPTVSKRQGVAYSQSSAYDDNRPSLSGSQALLHAS